MFNHINYFVTWIAWCSINYSGKTPVTFSFVIKIRLIFFLILSFELFYTIIIITIQAGFLFIQILFVM